MLRRAAARLAHAAAAAAPPPPPRFAGSMATPPPFASRLADPSLLRTDCLVAGSWIGGGGGAPGDPARIDVLNPATGAVLATVPSLGAAHVRAAVEGAHGAQPGWAASPARHRSDVLRRWAGLLHAHVGDLAAIMTAEQGKPLAEAKGEVEYSADYLLWFSEEAVRCGGDTLPAVAPGHFGLTVRVPVGVAALITPWNFPMLTPFSALAFAELGLRAGLPPGVLSILTGDASEIGAALTSHPLVRKLSFTGSTRVGRLLAAQCGPGLKRTSLELGGNAPFLVFDDADVAAAAAGAIASKFRNAGQTCISANRFYAQRGVAAAFAGALAAAMDARLVLGDGAAPGCTLGPLINAAAVAKCDAHVADAVAGGARLVRGGRASPSLGRTFYEPTLLAGVRSDALLCREETFGPVAGVVEFETEEEAVALANASEFGLAAYVFTRDAGRLFRVARALDAGMVGLNSGTAAGCAACPFGGVKASGHGREGSHLGVNEYSDVKYFSMAV